MLPEPWIEASDAHVLIGGFDRHWGRLKGKDICLGHVYKMHFFDDLNIGHVDVRKYAGKFALQLGRVEKKNTLAD